MRECLPPEHEEVLRGFAAACAFEWAYLDANHAIEAYVGEALAEIDRLRWEVKRAEILARDFEFKCAGCGSHTELGRGRGYICFCCPTSSFCYECAKGHFAGHDNVPPAQTEGADA